MPCPDGCADVGSRREARDWNINSVRAREARLVAWLAKAHPTSLCLQETKVEDAGFPTDVLKRAGYDVALFGQKSYNGVAIVSTLPIEDVTRGFGDDEPDDEARVIAATTATACAWSTSTCRTARSSRPRSTRTSSRGSPAARVPRSHRDDQIAPLVLCGDMNVTTDDRDVWSPEQWAGKIHCSAARARGARRRGRVRARRRVPRAQPDGQRVLVVGLPRRRRSSRTRACGSTTSSRPSRSRRRCTASRSIATRARARTRADHAPVIASITVSGGRAAPSAKTRGTFACLAYSSRGCARRRRRLVARARIGRRCERRPPLTNGVHFKPGDHALAVRRDHVRPARSATTTAARSAGCASRTSATAASGIRSTRSAPTARSSRRRSPACASAATVAAASRPRPRSRAGSRAGSPISGSTRSTSARPAASGSAPPRAASPTTSIVSTDNGVTFTSLGLHVARRSGGRA